MTKMIVAAIAVACAAAVQAQPDFKPHKPTNETKDQRDVAAALDASHAAYASGNVDQISQIVDFPVLMITDDSQGEAFGQTWDRDQFMKQVGALTQGAPPDVRQKLKHSRTYTFLTDSIVVVNQSDTTMVGGQKQDWRSFAVLIKRGGKWLVKAQGVGGYGDAMRAKGVGPQ